MVPVSLPDLIRSPFPPLPVSASHPDLLRLFFLPSTNLFHDAALPVSLTDPHVLHTLLLSPPLETLDTSSLISKIVSSYSPTTLPSSSAAPLQDPAPTSSPPLSLSANLELLRPLENSRIWLQGCAK
ncbi:hypothetical protein J5N97_021033 [Dioscorea zingiberensis]|uniref:Uncharacterized protein n=1 Tax=Dioscorea zingiberensis TaxID=325984 RepID=A0A9D5CHH4_9LILI|nr:hypothetical protein J5N97_021033 [Dioscorea zingiberensis]